MNKQHYTIVLIVAVIAVAGPSYAQDRPLTDIEKKLVADTYGKRLKDPLLAQFRWHNLIRSSSAKSDELIYCLQVTENNSYGGDVGFKTIFGTVTQRNGAIASYRYILGSENNPVMNDTAREFCDVAGYKFE